MDPIYFMYSFQRTAASLSNDLGRSIIELLESKYPGQKLRETPAEVMKKVQGTVFHSGIKSHETANDVLQGYLRYLVEKNHDFGTQSIQEAFKIFLHNVGQKAMSESMKLVGKKKKVSPEPEESEPGFDAEEIGDALDDKAAIKEFMDLLSGELPYLKAELSPDEAALFEVIFEQEIGTFLPDITMNMSQSTAVREQFPEIYEKNKKRWSGFIGDLRKKLLSKIEDFLLDKTGPAVRESMRGMMYG